MEKQDIIVFIIFERLVLVGITTTEIKDYINYYYNFDFKNCYYGSG
jgi:hypothetical protein